METYSPWFGLTDYQKGLDLQTDSFAKVKAGDGPFVLGMEHPLVLTLGLRSHEDPLMAVYEKEFPEVVKIRRGGHGVIHNPGQLVIYPVISLKTNGLSVKDYICLLVKSSKALLNEYGIEAFEKEEPGLFTDQGKIVMFGVGVSNGITQHGMCLNVRNDLSVFNKIALCNVENEPVCSMQSLLDQEFDLKKIYQRWTTIFLSHLEKQA